MLVSYHNHTKWSDGAPTTAEQIQGARLAGLDELGISDHYVLSPTGGPVEWSMALERVGDYVAELEEASQELSNPVLRVGIEVDFYPETVRSTRQVVNSHRFDFVIGSVHNVDGFPIDSHHRYWEELSAADRDGVWRLYWERIRQMASSGLCDVVAHLDLPKKYGHRPSIDLSREADAALDAIAAADLAIEINTAGWSLPAGEAYPSLELLCGANRRGIPLLISADAHSPVHLTRDFDRARALAREAGYTQLLRYERRRRFPIPL